DPLANYSPTTGRLPVILAYSLATARALSFAQYLERLVGTLRFRSPFPPARAPPRRPGGRSSVALQSRAPANLSDFFGKAGFEGNLATRMNIGLAKLRLPMELPCQSRSSWIIQVILGAISLQTTQRRWRKPKKGSKSSQDKASPLRSVS